MYVICSKIIHALCLILVTQRTIAISLLLSLLQWSYGVTCWEIFSLGRIPYPGVDNTDVIKFLKSGRRLERPYLCPADL